MNINTEIIIDMDTLEVESVKSFEYDGPVSLCGGGGGGKSAPAPAPPPPSAQETAPARETGETAEQKAERQKKRRAALAAGEPQTILNTLGTPATTQTSILGG